MSDIECPYCGADQEICHDDGHGYEEGPLHEQTCSACDKVFTFQTSISFSYEPYKADCLNDGEHQWKMTSTYPREYARWRCTTCDKEKNLTPEERAAAKATPQGQEVAPGDEKGDI